MTRFLAVVSLLVAIMQLALVGCSDDGCQAESGTVTLVVTGSPTDDLDLFQVDVTRISLRHSAGLTVDLVATPVRVDLASLGDSAEILRVLEVPSGTYDRGTITVDWSSAVALIAGQASRATIVDASGSRLDDTKTYELTFPDSHLTVEPGAHPALQFDFDADLSAEVTGTRVVVSPSVLVEMDPPDPKTFTVRGRLLYCQRSFRYVGVSVRRPRGGEIDQVSCKVLDGTTFQLGGVPYSGSQGFEHLLAMPAGTWVQVRGVLESDAQYVVALAIEAGAGTVGEGGDLVEGVVTRRVGGSGTDATLTVLGSSFDGSGSVLSLNQLFTVYTSLARTRVNRRGLAAVLTTNDVNVGQAVQVFGSLEGTTIVDATSAASVVRLVPTCASGVANGPPASEGIEITLQRISGWSVDLFDFTVSGVSQADVAHFRVGFGGDASSVTASTPVELTGDFPGVSMPGSSDFHAVDLVDRDVAAPLVRVGFAPASPTSLVRVGSREIEVDLTEAAVAVVDRGSAGTTAVPGWPTLTVRPQVTEGSWVIAKDTEETLHSSFPDFAADLVERQATGASLRALRAVGAYDARTNTMEAAVVAVVVE